MVLQESFCYKQMQKGSAFQKLRGHKKFSRVYKLCSTHTYITWYPTRTRGSKILISDIKRVKRGVNPNRNNVFPSSAISYSLTIFLKDQAIELLATTSDAADVWLVGLRYLVYRTTSHEHTVRGMWLSEEFNSLLENERGAVTPTNSTAERPHKPPSGVDSQSGVIVDNGGINSLTSQSQLNGHVPVSMSSQADYTSVYRSEGDGGGANRVENGFQQSSTVASSTSSPYSSSNTQTPAAVNLQTCISKIKDLSYYCAQFSLASLSARDSRVITEKEFIEMYEFYSSMDPVLSFIFQFNNNGDDYLTHEELATFLHVEFPYLSQVDDVYLSTVVEHYEPIPILRSENCLGIDGLITYLLSPDLSIMNPFHAQVNHDMSHPITHYFINSSHNSYLTGDQLYSQSSEEMVSRLLLDGVRHVELDLWDGPDGEPECYHGYTSTSKIKVIIILHAIKDSAFVNSSYPIILDLENHCSIAQQIKIAHYLRDVFRESLFIMKPTENFNIFQVALHNLQGKIFVKCKKLSDSEYSSQGSQLSYINYGEVSDENSADDLPAHCKTFVNTPSGNIDTIPANNGTNVASSVVAEDETTSEAGGNYEVLPFYEQRRKQNILLGRKPTVALSKYMSSLVTIKSVKFDIELLVQDHSTRDFNVLYGMNERDAVFHVREKFFDISSFCESNLVKLSPSYSRFNSSNPDPVQFWNAGIQCVAINQQSSHDKANRFNKALFKANGNSGYYLKPIYSSFGAVGGVTQESLQLEVMFYFVSRIQAFIQSSVAAMPSHRWTLQVEIKGHVDDTSTRYIDCMNLQPYPETFSIIYPSMAFFCLTLYEELSKSRKFSADFVIPVTSIAAGTKVIPLLGPSSCVVIADITAVSKPPVKQKRRKSFLKFGRSVTSEGERPSSCIRGSKKRNNSTDNRNRPSFEIYQSHSFRFTKRNNNSTPNLTSSGAVGGGSSGPSFIYGDERLVPIVPVVNNGLYNSTYEAHCATVAAPSSTGIYNDGFFTAEQRAMAASLRGRNRSSMHEAVMSSIANLFNPNAQKENSSTTVLNGLTFTPTHVANCFVGPSVSNYGINSNYEQKAFRHLSNSELRAALFDDYSTHPIYDLPLDEQQVTQSCHNSPLHAAVTASPYNVEAEGHQSPVFIGYSDASSYFDPSFVNAPSKTTKVPSESEQNIAPQLQSVGSSNLDTVDESLDDNVFDQPKKDLPPKPLIRDYPSSRSKMSSPYNKSSNYNSRWAAYRNGARREHTSFIRGRVTSLSDNDQFSSDEDDEQLTPNQDKTASKNVNTSTSPQDALVDDELNLSNLAAEIEEEFGAVQFKASFSEEDDSTSNRNPNAIHSNGLNYPPSNDATSSTRNEYPVDPVVENLDGESGFSVREDALIEESRDSVNRRGGGPVYTRQTSGYESGFDSPPLPPPTVEHHSGTSVGAATAGINNTVDCNSLENSSDKFFYQTTMV